MLPIRDLCATVFGVLLSSVFYEKKKIMWHFATDHQRDVYAALLMGLRNRSIALREQWCGSSHGRLIARWRHDRCFYSTRGRTGSLLVTTMVAHMDD